MKLVDVQYKQELENSSSKDFKQLAGKLEAVVSLTFLILFPFVLTNCV